MVKVPNLLNSILGRFPLGFEPPEDSRILLRRHVLRFQETCVGVAAVPREAERSETAIKEHNKLCGQKLSTLIRISSVLICRNC